MNTSLTDLGFGSSREAMMRKLSLKLDELAGLYRQYAANGNVKIGPITFKDDDLVRVQKIATKINSRRALYVGFEDENPQKVYDSMRDLKRELATELEGLWANSISESYVQRILNLLNDYLTRIEKIGIERVKMGSRYWREFIELNENLRIEIWTIIAILKKMYGGKAINPDHLPEDIWSKVNIDFRPEIFPQ